MADAAENPSVAVAVRDVQLAGASGRTVRNGGGRFARHAVPLDRGGAADQRSLGFPAVLSAGIRGDRAAVLAAGGESCVSLASLGAHGGPVRTRRSFGAREIP